MLVPTLDKVSITGSVSSISVEEGDEVLEGTEVAIVVAMKMNNSLKVELPSVSACV